MREETDKTTVLRERIEGLRRMTVGQLKITYREVFGEDSRSNHKQFLFRRVAWRIQANAQGGLSERAGQPTTLPSGIGWPRSGQSATSPAGRIIL